MTKNVGKLVVTAMISGLIAGSLAQAQDAGSAPTTGDNPPAKAKNSCKGADGCHKNNKCNTKKKHHKKMADTSKPETAPAAGGDATAPANPE